MPTTPKYYVFQDAPHLKAEGMTKEQIFNAIAEATGATPTNVDDGFITTIIETNNGRSLHIWKGTKAQYEALQSIDPNTFYIITDDTTVQDLQADYEDLQQEMNTLGQDVSDLKDTVYQIDDTGWRNWRQTPLSSETTYNIGRYRVKNGIAYFDLQDYQVELYQNVGDIINIPLPVKLDDSGKTGFPFVYKTYQSAAVKTYIPAQGRLTNNGQTLTIDAIGDGSPSSSLITELWGSFCYPVADDE